MIPELAWAFITGLAGSLHCLGMCGPLIIAYSLQLRARGNPGAGAPQALSQSPELAHHLFFHLGRTITYGFLGAMAAGLVGLGGESRLLMPGQSAVSLAAGILMVLFGLVLLKVLPFPFTSQAPGPAGGSVLARFMVTRLSSGEPGSGWLLGLGAGFLPCMLSWAMVVKAAESGDPFQGFFFMVLFGLGTLPLLLFTGLSASFISLRVRLAGERVAAISVIAMGFIMIWKGVAPFV